MKTLIGIAGIIWFTDEEGLTLWRHRSMLSGINNTETEADVWGASRVLSGRSLVSNLGCTELFVIEPRVKVNDGAY